MISIIICSADAKMLLDIKQNIKDTIGVPYEILSFENSAGKRSLCEVYNEGARMAKFDLLCFMHEDLEFKTIHWGAEVKRIFEQHLDVGIIGVAGGTYKSDIPSGWGVSCPNVSNLAGNFLQAFKRSGEPTTHHHTNPGSEEIAEVVCVDGMWFCTLKKIALDHPFDEKLLKGFHCYDIDFCLQVQQQYKVVVTFNILMKHFSEGGYNQDWFRDTLIVHEKWKEQLPVTTLTLTDRDKKALEKSHYKWILKKMIEFGFNLKDLFFFLRKDKKAGRLDTKRYIKYLYYSVQYQRKHLNT